MRSLLQRRKKGDILSRAERPNGKEGKEHEMSRIVVEKEKGNITRKAGSSILYFDFKYFGKRLEKSTGLPDNEENRKKARQSLTILIERLEIGTLSFAQAFPKASEKEKAYFSILENGSYSREPWDVYVGSYVDKWVEEIVANFESESKRHDYLQSINDWILPYFKDKTFYEMTSVELKRFIGQLRWRDTFHVGQALSGSRVRNIFIPLRKVWSDACSENHWQLKLANPFNELKPGDFPKKSKKIVRVFLIDEWLKLLEHMDSFYRPVAEIMIMTGMIGSEIAGLRKSDLRNGYIEIENKFVRRRQKGGALEIEKEELKNEVRTRRIPITARLAHLLHEVLQRTDSEYKYVFSMKDGSRFDPDNFREAAWETAFRKSKLDYVKPYATRHSFAGWGLTLRMDPSRLVYLMGHRTRKMIYETYGKYVEDIEKDARRILEYFGQDFIDINFKKSFHSFLVSESLCESGEVGDVSTCNNR